MIEKDVCSSFFIDELVSKNIVVMYSLILKIVTIDVTSHCTFHENLFEKRFTS